MKRKKLIWQLYPLQILITITSLLAVTWYISQSIRTFHLQQTAKDLEDKAYLIHNQVRGYLTKNTLQELQLFCQQAGEQSATRITVIMIDGLVVADSIESPSNMDNHADRPEIVAVMQNTISPSVRFSNTLQDKMMYVAIPVLQGDKMIAILRTSIPVSALDKALHNIYLNIFFVVFFVALVAAVGVWLTVRHISRPLEIMRRGAERFAKGELKSKLIIEGSEEVNSLANSLNNMAQQLNGRIQAVQQQRNELEAVFSSMMEGVYVIDSEEKFVNVNKAGVILISSTESDIKGKNVLEAVRNPDFLRFVKQTLSTEKPIEGEIVFSDLHENRFFQAHGVPLKNTQNNVIGGLIVVNDITRLRRLEKIRRDFVANVSHELRTPITSIKGFIETLLEGALEEPDNARNFLHIIGQQTNKLNDIIRDLLILSNIEQQSEMSDIKLARKPIKPIIRSAVQACSPAALKKSIEIVQQDENALEALVNNHLLEQALVNLIDNAIKYSSEGSRVEISTERSGKSISISINDNGPGINKEHHPRLFERFYRVDRSRSNKTEGTGLGLAIVKHIVQIHNGEIKVDSTFGKGSTFTILLQP